MRPEDEICLCFHVTKRKLENFARVEQPRRASQLAECFGAGTGCGWCRPFLQRIFDAQVKAAESQSVEPTADEYAAERRDYIRAGKGTPPPGATL